MISHAFTGAVLLSTSVAKFIAQLIRINFIEVKVAHALALVDLWRYGLATCPRVVGSGYNYQLVDIANPHRKVSAKKVTAARAIVMTVTT